MSSMRKFLNHYIATKTKGELSANGFLQLFTVDKLIRDLFTRFFLFVLFFSTHYQRDWLCSVHFYT